MASWQATLAFERTLISLDQTLMGTVRTSLAMISFGFAFILFFHEISLEIGVNLRVPARNFGVGLVAMGTGLVAIGLIGHRRRFADLKARMDELHEKKLLARPCIYRQSPIAVFAMLLLLTGVLAMASVLVRILGVI